jgi:3-phosphoshikimate 1-carboxyvinyltransferase
VADARVVEPLDPSSPFVGEVELPGSKSITNRALVCAARCEGTSTIEGALIADDTDAMVSCLRALGVTIDVDGTTMRVTGPPSWPDGAHLDARLSGTTSRFVLPLAALGSSTVTVDGAAPLRARPMGPTLDALRSLGATVEGSSLPVTVRGPISSGPVSVPGDTSSQFVSGLLLAGVDVHVEGPLVSEPYVALTRSVMAAFAEGPTTYRVEPDASAASYFFALAAMVRGSSVTVRGVQGLQGDWAFVDVLERMGASVERRGEAITVMGTGTLRGIDVDLAHISDTAQTLVSVATMASSPTRITGIGFIRRKETDRIGDTITELRRIGLEADEEPDGMVVHPGVPTGGEVQTYDDHRVAMSFALLGLVHGRISIADPDCVGKTFPGFWDAVERLR